MRFGSLFAGVGGFDLGFEAAGWQCCWQVEKDKACQQTLAYHWPSVKRYGDIQTVSGYDLEPVDVICFGSPCQDLSVAGRRKGFEGERSNLFFEATRLIKEMRDATRGTFPRYAVWENVVGSLNSRKGDDFEAVLKALADLGANHIEWSVLDAQFFGVPQRRRRVFVVACFDNPQGERRAPSIFAFSQGGCRNTSSCESKKQRDTTRIAELPRNPGIELQPIVMDRAAFNQGINALYDTYIERTAIMPPLVARGPHAIAHAGNENTLIIRRVTPIESERLMGWPDNHTLFKSNGKCNTDTMRYKMCGNGVASPVAQHVALQITAWDKNEQF